MTVRKFLFSFLISFIVLTKLCSQDATIYLWRDVKGMEKQPSVMYMNKAKGNNTGTAVIVCPGGSYHHLGIIGEGYTTCKWFSKNGVTAFMLKYRTGESFYRYPAMLEDVQRAIQIIRENAEQYGIDPDKIGVIGYSAGGHLSAMSGAFGDRVNELEKLGIKTEVSLRPDFVMPIYPVVSMQDDIVHSFSRYNLLGNKYTEEQKNSLSLELQIPDNMPPAFILVCKDDPIVQYENSIRLYNSIKEKNIQNCELHVYEWGKHGFGMTDGDFMKEFHWNEVLREWLIKIGMMN